MRYNPFKPGSIVSTGMFAGRIPEIITLEQALFQTKNRNPHHFLIHGERGIGKSSLLFYLQNVARGLIPLEDGTKFSFLTLNLELTARDSYISIIRKIGSELQREVAKLNPTKEFAKSAWDFLSKWEVMGVKYSPGSKEEPEEILEQLTSDFEQITGKLNDFDGIVIFIDEADKPTSEANLGGLFKLFTERLAKRDVNNVIFGLAGISTLLRDLLKSHESSLRIFEILTLEPLLDAERIDVIERAMEDGNKKNSVEVKISDSAKKWISTFSEGYPHFIQQFGYCAFENDSDNLIDENDVAHGALKENGAFQQLGHKYFQTMYFSQINSEDYRKVLNVMSKELDEWVSRQKIIKETGLKETTVNHAIEALKDRNIIIAKPGSKGQYRLPNKAFAVWISGLERAESRKSVNKLV